MVTKPSGTPDPGQERPQPHSPDGELPRPAPASRLSAATGLAAQSQADGPIRLSGRIPAGGDTQSIILSPGQRLCPADLGKAGCSWPRPPRLITPHRKATSPNR